MNKKILIYVIYLVICISFLLSLYFIARDIHLSIILLSGSVFFLFLSKNTEILMCASFAEIDVLIPKAKGKTYLYGSFIILIINLIFI